MIFEVKKMMCLLIVNGVNNFNFFFFFLGVKGNAFNKIKNEKSSINRAACILKSLIAGGKN